MKYAIIRAWMLALAILPSMFFNAAKAQQAEEPIIVIHSTAWQEVGEGNQFSMFISTAVQDYYDIDMGAGLNELEIEPGYVNTETGDWEGTWVPLRVNEEGVIKIYGDPENINVISIDGGYVTSIEMDKCVNLEVLSLQHNVLENLDLTPFKNLSAIYLSDNPFTGEQSLVIGPDKPYLAILEMDIIEKIADGFNLSDYPSMVVFDGYYNFGLKSIDTSGCPNLMSLSLEMTAVESLDLSNNPLITSLNISESRITHIDLSKQTNLRMLQACHESGWVNTDIRLAGIDLSNNPELFYLNLSGNHLGHIDLSNNKLITNLLINRNDLTEIDLTGLTELYSVALMYNNLDYATLPLPQDTWGEYYYIQNDLPLAKSIAQGEVVDMSARVLREGTTTTAVAWASPVGAEPYVLEEAGFEYDGGKFSFSSIPADSVYVQFINDAFEEYSLKTSKFKVKDASEIGKPSKIISLSMAMPLQGNIQMAVGMSGASETQPKKFYLDFGDGQLVEFESAFADMATSCNVDVAAPEDFAGYVHVYVPEGEVMTSFAFEGQQLNSANVQLATELRHLSLNGCGLYSIDLGYNRCLQSVDVSNNNLNALDLTGVYGNYAKNVLTDVRASHNKLSSMASFQYNDTKTFTHLDLSYNELESFKLLEFENLDYVDLSHNNLCEELYLTYQIAAHYIDLSYNELPSVVIDYFDNLDYLNLSNNKFNMGTLPLSSEVNAASYVYAPQQPYELSHNAPAVNLTVNNRVVDGIGTTFVWHKEDGAELVNGVDVDCKDGATRFLKYDLGPIYCTMTNPAFPQFAGNDIYCTTSVNPVEAPNELVASFVTSNSTTAGSVTFTASTKTELYIDWRGDGSEYLVYPVETSYINYPDQVTYAGAEVKVYTYDSADLITVFSISNIGMERADLTPLSNAICITLSGAGLGDGDIKMPLTAPLTELTITGGSLTSFPWAENYPKLDMLVLSNNKFAEFDASAMPNLGNLFLSSNELTDIRFDNPRLWSVNLSNNAFESIDLNGLPDMEQLDLSHNSLSSIDLAPIKSTLRALSLQANKFDFSTLPLATDLPKLMMYYYGAQPDLVGECVDGVVDLSAPTVANGVQSTFVWYLGEAVFDEDNQVWTGEELIAGDEYETVDGVTAFNYTFDEPVMAIITNEVFPNLTLKTNMIDIDSCVGSVGNVSVQSADDLVNVYSISGILLRAKVAKAHALDGLPKGYYIVGNRKVAVK